MSYLAAFILRLAAAASKYDYVHFWRLRAQHQRTLEDAADAYDP